MQKIISLFQRNYDGDRLIRNAVAPGAEWVINGEGIATRKFDGTCCMIKDGVFYKRYELKKGKTSPLGFIAAQQPDQITGDCPGWLTVGDGSEDKFHREAYNNSCIILQEPGMEKMKYLRDGTYELVGPKINGNKEHWNIHRLIEHGSEIVERAPRTFEELKEWFQFVYIEGLVWHHPDGRMVKIKKKDFGYKW